MDFKSIVYAARSVRRFDSSRELSPDLLRELIDLARMTPSGMNLQWLKYIPVRQPALREQVFGTLSWAGYLKDWAGPEPNERPTGYIILLEDHRLGKGLAADTGIAAQTLMLGARAQGVGACMIAGIRREELSRILNLPEGFTIALVLALGYPAEEVVVEPLTTGGDIKYWRTGNLHHVPKRSLEEIILKEM